MATELTNFDDLEQALLALEEEIVDRYWNQFIEVLDSDVRDIASSITAYKSAFAAGLYYGREHAETE